MTLYVALFEPAQYFPFTVEIVVEKRNELTLITLHEILLLKII